MKRILLLAAFFIASLGVVSSLSPTVQAAWNPFNNTNDQSICRRDGTSGTAVCSATGDNPISGSNGVLSRVTRLIAVIAGVAAVIVIIVAGIVYITANGDPGKISTAKNTIIYASVGLIIIVVSSSIIIFVVNRVT